MKISKSKILLKAVKIFSGGSTPPTTQPSTDQTSRIVLQNGNGYVATESGTGNGVIEQG